MDRPRRDEEKHKHDQHRNHSPGKFHLIAAVNLWRLAAVVAPRLRYFEMAYTSRQKTTAKIAPVIVSTTIDNRKIESAGVDCGLKMLGIWEGSAGPPKQSVAASKKPISNTPMPAILLTSPRVCPLYLICVDRDLP